MRVGDPRKKAVMSPMGDSVVEDVMKLEKKAFFLVLAAIAMLGWAGCGGGCPTSSLGSTGGSSGPTAGVSKAGSVCGPGTGGGRRGRK